MDVAKSFDAYEVIGVITPGSVVTLLMALQWPEFRALLGQEGLSVGGLGVFVVTCFVVGHLVQAAGNLVDGLVWMPRGLPTAWVRHPHQQLITPAQREQLQARIVAMEPGAADIAVLDRAAWRGVTARMYGRVNTAGRAGRIDICNRTYGLSRGLAAAFLVSGVWLAIDAAKPTSPAILAWSLAAVALFRMVRAGVHYARSLLIAFIDLPDPPLPVPGKP